MNLKEQITLAVVLLLILVSLAVADDKLLLPAGGLRNDHVAIAFTNDGSVALVVVGRSDDADGDFGEVHGVLLKRKKGSFVVKKQFLISVGGATAGRPDVAWDESSGKFIAVWDSVQSEAMNQVNAGKIMARLVTKKGKPKGAAITVVNSNNNDTDAILAPLNQPGNAPAATGYRLFFSRYPTSWGNRPDTGIWSLRISNKGKPLDKPTMVRRGSWQDDTSGSTGRYWYFGITAEKAFFDDTGSTAAATEVFGPIQNVSYKAYLLRVNAKGEIKALVDLAGQASSFNADACPIQSGNFLTSWYEPKAGSQYDRVFNTNFLPQRGKYTPLKGEKVWYTSLVPIDKGAAVQFSSTASGAVGPALEGNALYLQLINSKGKLKGSPIPVLSHSGSLGRVRAVAVPGTTLAYAVWVRALSNTTSEVHGVVVDYANPDSVPADLSTGETSLLVPASSPIHRPHGFSSRK